MTLHAWDRVRLAASLIGLGIAVYLAVQHYVAVVPLICSTSGTINCERVLSSPAASWAGIPVAVWGMGWFSVAVILAICSLLRPGSPEPPWLRWVGVAWTVSGTAAVVWLLYNELIVIGSICAWCTVVQLLIVGLFVIQVLTDGVRASG